MRIRAVYQGTPIKGTIVGRLYHLQVLVDYIQDSFMIRSIRVVDANPPLTTYPQYSDWKAFWKDWIKEDE